ncbi:MAG TPA: STAS domain-containing protein [Burkholderiaceae bacterium]|jgi:phospholipid transport system transporter-binding protein
MLLLPATVTAREAVDTRRLLTQAVKTDGAEAVIVDASNLTHFDSSAIAVLLECHRAADAWGKPFELRNPPSKLAALVKLYGVEALLLTPAAVAAA